MADISAIPFVNFGGEQAKQGLATAQTGLVNQQAQAAAQQNQLMAAKMPVMLAAYKEAQGHITDFSNQTNGHNVPTPDYDAASDASGAAQRIAGNPQGQNVATPYDLIGRDGKAGAIAQAALQSKYQVSLAGAPQEQARIEAAADWKARASMIDPDLGTSAGVQLDQAKYVKDQAVKDRTNQNNTEASQYYEALSTAHDAPHPFQALTAISPAAAARVKAQTLAQNPNASDDDLDQAAQNSLGSTAAFLHRFTGRPTEKGEDGIFRDKDTQLPVTGVTPAGFKPEDIAKIRETGMAITTKTVNGQEVSKHNYEWAGKDNVDQYVQQAVGQARALQTSQANIEQRRQHAVVIQAHAGIPAEQRIPPPGSTPGAVVQSIDKANTPAAQGAVANHQATKPPGAPPPPATVAPPPKSATAAPSDNLPASTNSPTGKLDLSDIQHSKTSNTPMGGLPQGAKASDQDKDYWKAVQAKNAELGQTAQGANSTIQIATNAQNALKADAATGNTASSRQWVMTTLNNPSSLKSLLGDATSSAILRKMLGNVAFTNIENDANGNNLRLGANTIKVAMEKLSASPEMTPEAITALSGQMIKNATYEKQKAGADYANYKQAGGDVTDYDRWYGNKYPNKTTIDQTGGVPEITNQKDYDALAPGAAYTNNGKPHTKPKTGSK